VRSVLKQPAKLIALAIFTAAVLILILPVPAGFDPKLTRTAALLVAALAFLATHILPEQITFLAFMLTVVVMGLAPVEVAFGGFAASSIWLVFGGNLISLAMLHTGLMKRVGAVASMLFSLSYVKILIVVTYASLAVGLFMPATVSRIVILVPIALAIADRLGFHEGRPGRHGIALAAGIGTFLPGAGILPANLPNVVMAGAAETAYGIHFTYGQFLLWHFPVSGLLKAALLVCVLLFMYPDKRDPTAPAADGQQAAINMQQRLLQFLLIATVCLWATDFVHRIAPGYISLTVAVIILLPALKLSPPDALHGKVNMAPFFQVVGILGIGGVVQYSGLGMHIAQALIDFTAPKPDQLITNFAIVAGISSFLCFVATGPGAPVVLAPLAQDLAAAMGLPLFTVLNMMVFGVSIQLLPYVGPPFIVAMSLTGTSMRDGVRLCVSMAILSAVVLGPLTFLWWKILGFLG
jgi:di/tricarboxylate transporter